MIRALDPLFLRVVYRPGRRARAFPPGTTTEPAGIDTRKREETKAKPPRWNAPGHWVERDEDW